MLIERVFWFQDKTYTEQYDWPVLPLDSGVYEHGPGKPIFLINHYVVENRQIKPRRGLIEAKLVPVWYYDLLKEKEWPMELLKKVLLRNIDYVLGEVK